MRILLSAAVLAAGLATPVLATPVLATPALAADTPTTLLNASFDVGRELFQGINDVYIAKLKAAGKTLAIEQSHAGTSKQARSIIEGLNADVVTFNQSTDITVLEKAGYVAAGWQAKLPNKASPFYSFPAFLVRAGNPKNIKDWSDLARDDVKAVFPNPKTSGNARYTYLAARAWANEAYKGDEAQVTAYLKKLFANVPVFDTGGRASTTTFAERGIGDVLITFESEVLGTQAQLGADKYQVVLPSVSLLAEFPVAVVDKVVDQRGSRALAEDYLKFLYSPEAQAVEIKNFYRTTDEKANEAAKFKKVRLVTVEDAFGGWDKVAKEHFSEGGLLDKVFVAK